MILCFYSLMKLVQLLFTNLDFFKNKGNFGVPPLPPHLSYLLFGSELRQENLNILVQWLEILKNKTKPGKVLSRLIFKFDKIFLDGTKESIRGKKKKKNNQRLSVHCRKRHKRKCMPHVACDIQTQKKRVFSSRSTFPPQIQGQKLPKQLQQLQFKNLGRGDCQMETNMGTEKVN